MKGHDWEAQAATTQRNINTKRHAKYINNFTQEDIVGYLAQIRLLEDEVMAERYKCEKLQTQSFELVQTITHLEKSVSELRYLLQKADLQIKRHYEANKEFESYSKNLKEAGHELSSMNQIVEKKNKQCQKLGQLNAKFKQENAELENKLKLFHNRRQLQKSKIREILESLNTDAEPSFTDDLIRDLQLLDYGIQDLKQNLNKSKNAVEKQRKETSEMLMKQKQKIIGLQYSLKLSEQRNRDLQKKRNIQSTLTFDKKIEDLIDQMLKKEQELAIRVNQLETQNQQLKQQLDSQRVAQQHLVELGKKQLEKELKEAKQVIKQLIAEKDQLTDRLEQFSNIKDMESSRFMSEQLELSRKNREFYEQNRRLKLKINELESDKKMLQKELCIRNNI